MIASVGLRTLVENHVDFTKNRNLCIAAVMLVLAIGGATIGGSDFSFSGIGLGIISGIILNICLPEKKADSGLIAHSVNKDEIISEKK
ncbi:Uracil permease [bioreactor metagenome]|uniref:Uracil permease n=1 Tax=bioreactor metagenome TaxID=1076179 RepID=A0A645GDT9_9ZZZZ